MNPFIYTGPIRPDLFIGRDNEINTVLKRLVNPKDQGASAISGARGIGKTSFLQYIIHKARQDSWNLSGNNVCFIFLGCASIPLVDGYFSEVEFWRYVLRSLLTQKLPGKIKTHVKRILVSENIADSYELGMLFKEIANSDDRVIVLLLDEFEYLMENSPSGPGLLYTLRSLLNQPAPRGLTLITASKERLNVLGSRLEKWRGSPFYNIFAYFPLEPFSKNEVNALVDCYLKGNRIEFSETDCDMMYQFSGGHPAQVQYACSLLFDLKSKLNEIEMVNQGDYTEIKKAVEERSRAIEGIQEESFREAEETIDSVSEISSEAVKDKSGPSPGKRLVDVLRYMLSDPLTRLIFVGLIIFSFIPWIAVFFLSIPTIKAEQINRSELGYAVEYPSFIVTHETESFSITLINRQPISLTHVSATLVFSDDMPVSSETTVVEFEDLAHNEQKTGAIQVTFKQPVQVEEFRKRSVVEPVAVILEVNADQFTQTISTTYTLEVVHLPWAKTVGRWLGGGFLVGLPGVFLWMLRGAFKDVFPE